MNVQTRLGISSPKKENYKYIHPFSKEINGE